MAVLIGTGGSGCNAGKETVLLIHAGFLNDLKETISANLLMEQRWLLIVEGLWATLLISVGAAVMGTVMGVIICVLHMSSSPTCRFVGTAYIQIIRGMPVVLLLMLIFYVAFAAVSISPVGVATIAFSINFGAYAAVMFRNGMESVPVAQKEAGLALGFTRLQTLRRIVVPQALLRILPVYRSEFITMVKTTSVVGYIGVQDLTRAGDIIRSRTFEAFFPLLVVALLYFGIIGFLGLGLDYLGRRMAPRRSAPKAKEVPG